MEDLLEFHQKAVAAFRPSPKKTGSKREALAFQQAPNGCLVPCTGASQQLLAAQDPLSWLPCHQPAPRTQQRSHYYPKCLTLHAARHTSQLSKPQAHALPI